MISEKFLCLFVFLLTICKGSYFLNSTEIEQTTVAVNWTLLEKRTTLGGRFTTEESEANNINTDSLLEESKVSSEFNGRGRNSSSGSQREIIEIFHGVSNSTNITDEVAVNSTTITDCVNVTCLKESWNDTVRTNYSLVSEAVGALSSEASPYRLEKSAAIAAGIFLVSAIFGYLSCVGYRRFLQRKYGNSQILTGEEVYDTTDLRYFEI